MKRFFAALALAALAIAPVFSQAPDVSKILRELDDMGDFSGRDFSAVYTIVSQKPGEKETVTQARMFRRDGRKQFVLLIVMPEVNKGQGYLREDDNVWFYDSGSRKFSHSSIKENIQNSEAKNSDLTKRSLLDDYGVAATTEGTIGKYPVWVIDLKAKNTEVSYERMKLHVRKDQNMILKEEDFSVSGRLMRTTLFPKYADVGGKLIPSQILIIDELNPGEKSQLTLTEQSVAALPDSVFTKAFLEKVNK
ncbi:MAG: outer membrane lipoprotein-sorting protein [Spirochaetes bacterium]|nr:outer membrane lipoprotein-sorting protein [Spirochaetota bacterium]